jgi:hypothetical protein
MSSWRHLAERYRSRVAAEVARCWGKVRAAAVVDPEADPFDGAGEGLNDATLCAEVAKNVLTGRYRWVRGLGWLTWTGTHWTATADQAVAEEPDAIYSPRCAAPCSGSSRPRPTRNARPASRSSLRGEEHSVRAASPPSPHWPAARNWTSGGCAVRLVYDSREEYKSEWKAIESRTRTVAGWSPREGRSAIRPSAEVRWTQCAGGHSGWRCAW